MKIALVVPHIFMHQRILPRVIFSPGHLTISLAKGLAELGHEVTLFSPGSVDEYLQPSQNQEDGEKHGLRIKNQTADLSRFEAELEARGDDYLDLLKKHPLTYITLARQVQAEIVAQAYEQANQDQFDLVHVWTNEEELALVNARFCQKPVVFTHHEPFSFLVKYRSIFPKYSHLNWISISKSQQQTLNQQVEDRVSWVGNVYHGLKKDRFKLNSEPGDYLVYMGRIIKPKGVHLAIKAAKQAGKKLKIAGKHYAGHSKDKYWQEQIKPQLDGEQIEYLGFVRSDQEKQQLLGNAQALLMPSTWSEPFGLVMIEALACGTPVIGFDRGAIPEVIENEKTGRVIAFEPSQTEQNLARMVRAIKKINSIKRQNCRRAFEEKFTSKKMLQNYHSIYQRLVEKRLE